MGLKTFILYLERFPGEPDFLAKLPAFFKTLGAEAWGIEWSRFFPWTLGHRFGSPYKYPEECVQGLLKKSGTEGVSFLPVVDPQILIDLVLECGCFEYMGIGSNDSMVPKLDPAAIGGRQLLDEILENLFSLYTDEGPLMLLETRAGENIGITEKIAGYIEERFDIRVLRIRPGDDSIVFIEEPRRPWLRMLHRILGAETARESSVYKASKEVDLFLKDIEGITEDSWRRVRETRELLTDLQERTYPCADLREGEAHIKKLSGNIEKIRRIFEEIEAKTRGILEPSHLRGLSKTFLFPLEEERALVEARLKQFAPPRRKKKP
ncbi:MAG: hypothetical protein ACLFRY_07650 [Spirochaetia bacterium]